MNSPRSHKPNCPRLRTPLMRPKLRNSSACLSALLVLGIGLALLALGCKPAPPTPPANSNKTGQEPSPLRVLVIDDQPLGGAIDRQWTSRTESEIDISHATSADIASARRLPADVVVYPTTLLGELTERSLIVPVQPEVLRTEDFAPSDLLGQIRQAETRWGHETAAVPLGSPQLLLIYRANLFERLKLESPKTWAEYQSLVERLRDPSSLPDDHKSVLAENWQATAEPLTAGWAGPMLLARAASYATHRDQVAVLFNPDSMAPLLDQPPFVRALEELAAVANDQSLDSTPAAVVERVASGQAAMGIGFPDAVATGRSATENDATASLAFTPLPGSPDVFNFGTGQWEPLGDEQQPRASLFGLPGRQAAVSSSANQNRAAMNFLVWLSSSEISARTSPSSPATAPFRKSQLPDTGRWLGLPPPAAGSCASALEQSLSQKRGIQSLRIPGSARYLAALDEAVRSVIRGERTAEEALKAAADEWQKITDSLGRDQQRLAYRRSLNVADWP